jgi:hypothetical protein
VVIGGRTAQLLICPELGGSGGERGRAVVFLHPPKRRRTYRLSQRANRPVLPDGADDSRADARAVALLHWHRWFFGTSPSTCSTWAPHPAQLGRPQREH